VLEPLYLMYSWCQSKMNVLTTLHF